MAIMGIRERIRVTVLPRLIPSRSAARIFTVPSPDSDLKLARRACVVARKTVGPDVRGKTFWHSRVIVGGDGHREPQGANNLSSAVLPCREAQGVLMTSIVGKLGDSFDKILLMGLAQSKAVEPSLAAELVKADGLARLGKN